MKALKPGEIVLDQTINDEHVVIRYPTVDDVEAMLAYINSLSAEETYIGRQGEQLTDEDEEKHLRKVLEGMQKNLAIELLFFCNDELCGIADIHGTAMGAMAHTGGLGISLHNTKRGQGFGSLLMELLLEEMKKHMGHLKIIKLDAFGENEAGIALYKKFGFTEYGRLPGGFMRKGQPHTHISMYKKL